MHSGRVPGQFDIRWPRMAECPCSHGRLEGTLSQGRRETSCSLPGFRKEGLKPSLATTTPKASRRVIAVPLGLEPVKFVLGQVLLFSTWLYKSGSKAEFAYDDPEGFSQYDLRSSWPECREIRVRASPTVLDLAL